MMSTAKTSMGLMQALGDAWNSREWDTGMMSQLGLEG